MHATCSYDYAVLRVVPRVEREEFVNAGVILFCLQRRYLACRTSLQADRLRALWPAVDAETVFQHLAAAARICSGDADGGPIARLSQRERFHWLTAPRSTVLQTSPVRTGVCSGAADGHDDLERTLAHLAANLLSC